MSEQQTVQFADKELEALARESLGNAMLGKLTPDQNVSGQVGSKAGDGATGGESASSSGNKTSDNTDSSGESDPLKDVPVEELLKHPVLGPQLQSRIDRIVASGVQTRVSAAIKEELPKIRAQVEQEQLGEYLNSLSPDERAKVLAGDEDVAAAWSRIQAEKQQQAQPPDLTAAAQLHAYQAVISTWNNVIAGSDLPDDVKATLAPEKFAGQENGIVLWGSAIQKALIEHEVQKALPKAVEEHVTAQRNNQDAGTQKRPGAIPSGSKSAPVLQPGEAKTNDLWEQAFSSQRQPNKVATGK